MKNQLAENVAEINQAILAGRALEAFEKHYATNVVMQENDNEPTVGKLDNLHRQQEFFSNVTAFLGAEVKSVTLAENRSVVEWFLHYQHRQWGERKFHQVAVQQWENGQIIHEKFYYGT
ncbi:hypothetical protein CLV24_14314 [Pontibacter ummariensis]|uniref:SnoaL-like domain-containing protein n=1 Tax=Pontibacter ummariensis TaxID=1610492 RepID=A0A239LIK7_9BACT|nr:SnoaL-like domain-containing protein [Pontibacter ummariensis]PRY03138.1 hypothetical protein CLV24_14314 [Pontibacter ummariensis]SNT30426.1 hypothetical protein SAMN06296052_14314 [Pontibacter ummariensis]